ncbi:MAG: hypothetical protein KatS3mg090_0171 [Patescibacteria group bacterium]|nr:MAG: hypothetical protein KatS3mg090_0171 [Patescibacteria group bacterium]
MKNTSRIPKKIGLYNPYLDVLGGGELHILSILKVLEDQGYSIDVFWDQDLSEKIQTNFKLNFSSLRFRKNIFRQKNFINTVLTLKDYDVFFYVSDGSYFFSTAKKNFVFYMVPEQKLFNFNLLTKLKLLNWRFIANSNYTASLISKWTGKKISVIYPYIDSRFYNFDSDKKKIILSVGRFFKGLHSKRQDLIIKTFIKLKLQIKLLKEFKLVLIGRVKEEDLDYFQYIKKLAGDRNDILILNDLSADDVLSFYKQAMFYWHFTGWGLRETNSFEKAEHFGISIAEAMASKSVVFAYDFGGPVEIITHRKTGFLIQNEKDLQDYLTQVLKNSNLRKSIADNARAHIIKNFSYSAFSKKVAEVVLK